MSASVYMERTEIPARRTVAQIIEKIGESAMVRACSTSFDRDGRVAGVDFALELADGEVVRYSLPARVEPLFDFFQKRRPVSQRQKGAEVDSQKAERVAWRQVLRWVEAQLAMVDTRMVAMDEVFLPYALVPAA